MKPVEHTEGPEALENLKRLATTVLRATKRGSGRINLTLHRENENLPTRKGLERLLSLRPCRRPVEGICILARRFGLGKTFADYLRHCHSEPLGIVEALAAFETNGLFVNVLIEMERLKSHIGSAQGSLQEQPEVFHAVDA